MYKNAQKEISNLKLDLKNSRTTPQKNEIDAINAMISISPNKFFALMDSILEIGYLQTENIILLDVANELIVKEGNRRVAVLKIIHSLHKSNEFGIPDSTIKKINELNPEWIKENSSLSCIIFDEKEKHIADKIVSLTHGKGENAGRDKWPSVATARHNRDISGKSEPALDLLEKYLLLGQNLTPQQRDRWAGDYNLTVLADAISKITSRLEVSNATELVIKYPKTKYNSGLEDLMRDIGLGIVGFPKTRDVNLDFALAYGINPIIQPDIVIPTNTSNPTSPQNITNPSNGTQNTNIQSGAQASNSSTNNSTTPIATPSTSNPSTTTVAPKAVAVNDPKNVSNRLKKFNPRGNNRQKVVTLKQELLKLKINDNPIAFCFIMRSMFEISAKAYCTDHNISMIKSGNKDKTLVEILRDVTGHLTVNNSDKGMVKVLHGAMSEVGNPDRLLSVTSMNQLVHNPSFSVIPNDICVLFSNVFPLLEAMN